MKATGIVRRIDDLGRVVIPKEIRRTMRIREGDPLEIYTDSQGEVIFKKYSPMGDLAEFMTQYADVLNKALGMSVFISDRDHIVAFGGSGKKDFIDKRISSALEDVMENRSGYVASPSDKEELLPVEGISMRACIAFPIIGNGDVSGCVGVLFNRNGDYPVESQTKLVEVAAQFLGKQTED